MRIKEMAERLVLIGYAKEAGFSLSQIGPLLEAAREEGFTFEDLSGFLRKQRDGLDRRIEELSRMRSRIEAILDACPRKARLDESLFGEVRHGLSLVRVDAGGSETSVRGNTAAGPWNPEGGGAAMLARDIARARPATPPGTPSPRAAL